MEIKELIEKGEGTTLEFKEKLPSSEQLARLISAFANTEGGDLVVGIKDSDLDVVGVGPDKLFDLEQKIKTVSTQLVKPSTIPLIKIVQLENKTLMIAHFEMGFDKPYSVVKTGKSYMRIGSSTSLIDKSIEKRLALQAMGLSWDSRPVLDASLKDLDWNLIEEFLELRKARTGLAPPKKADKAWLRKTKIAEESSGELYPSAAGLLMFSESPETWFPNCGVEAARFLGRESKDFADKKHFRGPVWKIYDEALIFLERHLPNRAVRKARSRQEHLAYPELSFREFLINALVHRIYGGNSSTTKLAIFDDIIEITSFGPFPVGLGPEDIGVGVSVLRNPIVARLMRELGLIEGWGTGIINAQKELAKRELPPAKIESKGFFTQVSSNWSYASKMSAGERKVLNFLEGKGAVSSKEISKKLNLGERAVRASLSKLGKAGLVIKTGSTKLSLYQKWE